MENVELKIGVEVHQQLEGKKLFCDCSTLLRDDAPQYVIKRKLRAVVGETGEVDVAAAHEMAKGQTYAYEGYNDSTCLIELDEAPPRGMNADALRKVLQFLKLTKAKLVDEVQVMRKTVVNGSNTSGFQRTALVGYDGVVDVGGEKVRIATVCLEEDACRDVHRTHEEVTYRLDRLGIPLMEIATEPDIRSPEQCERVLEHIGLMLRSIPGVKRGLGTIRQDVNVSTKGAPRIEIKGAQDLRMVPTLVRNEVQRQQNLLKIKQELMARIKTKVELVSVDVTNELKSSSSKVIQDALKKGGRVIGLRLPQFHGLIGKETQPGKRFGTELSERAKIAAGVQGLFHSDELPAYGITEEEKKCVAKALQCSSDDGFVLIAAEKERAVKGIDAVKVRVEQAFVGVPKEVRKANMDGTTSFLRPMPGAARMYPETDVLPVRVKDFDKVLAPKLITERAAELERVHKLGKDLAAKIVRSPYLDVFEELVSSSLAKPAFIAETLVSFGPELSRNYGVDSEKVTESDLQTVLTAFGEGRIAKESIVPLLVDVAGGKGLHVDKYALLSDDDVKMVLKDLLVKKKGLPVNALIGEAMKVLKGKADGQKVVELLKKLVEFGY